MIVPCSDYRKVLDSAAGWAGWPDVGGKVVFLKPNLVFPPIGFDKWSVTNPAILCAVLSRLRDERARLILVGDCGFKGQWGPTIEAAGYDQICRHYGASLICVQDGDNYHRYSLRRLENYRSLYGSLVSNYVLAADVVINLPKMKVHSMCVVTGAIKNMMGVIRPKGAMHPRSANDVLHRRLADLYYLMKPIVSYVLMDGIVGSEYAEHWGRPRRANVLIAGRDMWTVDCQASEVMGFHPAEVGYLRMIHEDRKEWPPTARAHQVNFEPPLIAR